MNKQKLIIGIVCILVAGGGIWLFSGRSPKDKIRLETTTAGRSSISNTVTATGTVEPVTEVKVGTQVSGIIHKLYADYNDVVKAGQLIAEMDKVNLEAELAAGEAQLESSRVEYEYQQKNYARNKVLFEKKLISDSDFETATYNYERAKAAYDQSKASIIQVKRNLEYATITSPINGVIINKAVEEGQTVAAGFETPTLYTIAADLTKMQVIADVDEADIGAVKEGQRVTFTVDAYPNDVFEGTVMQIRLGEGESDGTVTSSATVVTYEVVISADNPELKLKPRLTANVTIFTLERDNVLTVPGKAFRFIPDAGMLAQTGYTLSDAGMPAAPGKAPGFIPDAGMPAQMGHAPLDAGMPATGGKRLIWIVNGTALTPRLVSTGSTSGNLIEVTEGLDDGEIIAVDWEVLTKAPVSAAGMERSPFMPGPPGSDKKKKDEKK